MNDNDVTALTDRLKILEYAIRKSITVREDQDEPADQPHREEAAHCGIPDDNSVTKGDLLTAVQTLVRSLQRKG